MPPVPGPMWMPVLVLVLAMTVAVSVVSAMRPAVRRAALYMSVSARMIATVFCAMLPPVLADISMVLLIRFRTIVGFPATVGQG